MFEKLQIKNVRIHKEQEIEFAPDITTIVGDSFTGKSTIVKALIWILRNKPSGDSIINWDAQKAIGTLTIDGNTIKRIKGKGKNIYKLNKKKFVAFGKGDVPSEIKKLANISNINIQGQFEPFFWFSKTAGEVSRQLNQIVNLDIIDKTMANIASEIRKTSATVDVSKTRLAAIKAQRKNLLYAKVMDEDLKAVENKQNRHQKNFLRASTINDIINMATKYAKTIKNARGIVSLGDFAISTGQMYLDIKAKSDNLKQLIKNCISLKKQAAVKTPSTEPLDNLYETYQKTKKQKVSLDELIGKIIKVRRNVSQLKAVFIESEKIFKTKMGKVCVLCGSQIK